MTDEEIEEKLEDDKRIIPAEVSEEMKKRIWIMRCQL